MGACHGPPVDSLGPAPYIPPGAGGISQSCAGCCSAGAIAGTSILGGACGSSLSCKYHQDIDLDYVSPAKASAALDVDGRRELGFPGRSPKSRASCGASFAGCSPSPRVSRAASAAIREWAESSEGVCAAGGFGAEQSDERDVAGAREDAPEVPATGAADGPGQALQPLSEAARANGLQGDSQEWHGAGVLAWPDGRRYVGQFVHGAFEGEATMEWPDGRRYIGQYCQNKKHGEGAFFWPDGRRYTGQWSNGLRHGHGVYTNAKGEKRGGTWSEDRPVSWDCHDVEAGAKSDASALESRRSPAVTLGGA